MLTKAIKLFDLYYGVDYVIISNTMKNKLFSSLLVLLGVFSAPTIVFATSSQISIDKNECHDVAPKDNKWSEAEKWVWENLWVVIR